MRFADLRLLHITSVRAGLADCVRVVGPLLPLVIPLCVLCRPKGRPDLNEVHSALAACKKVEDFTSGFSHHALDYICILLRVIPSMKQWVEWRTELEVHPREVEHPERLNAWVSADDGLITMRYSSKANQLDIVTYQEISEFRQCICLVFGLPGKLEGSFGIADASKTGRVEGHIGAKSFEFLASVKTGCQILCGIRWCVELDFVEAIRPQIPSHPQVWQGVSMFDDATHGQDLMAPIFDNEM